MSPREAADRKAVEAAWLKYWDVYTNMMDVPKDKRRQVYGTVMVDPQLSETLDSADYADKNHLANAGTVTHRIRWDASLKVQSDWILADCMDQTKFGTIDTKTKEMIVRGDAKTRMNITLTQSSGIWKVVGIVYKKSGPPC